MNRNQWGAMHHTKFSFVINHTNGVGSTFHYISVYVFGFSKVYRFISLSLGTKMLKNWRKRINWCDA
jgi:hypothetical protein